MVLTAVTIEIGQQAFSIRACDNRNILCLQATYNKVGQNVTKQADRECI